MLWLEYCSLVLWHHSIWWNICRVLTLRDLSLVSQCSLISDNYSRLSLSQTPAGLSPAESIRMAARSISSRPSPSFSSSSSLARSPSSLSSPRGGYSFSSGYTTSGFSFSSYISSSASGYSSLASPTPVVLRRKTSGLSRQEYKTRSKSVDASQIFQAGEIHQLERAKTPCSLDRSLSTERASGGNTRVPARKSSVYGFTDRSRDCSVSRASSEVPELEVGDLAEEKVRTKPVRNRQSHGVSQFDLERAATWAMIGSNKSPGPLQPQPVLESAVVENSETNQIDYKKVYYDTKYC